MITGESVPVLKTRSANCIAGTIVADGTGYVQVESVGQDTAVSQIVELMANAQSGKAPIQHLADTISAFFVPVVLAISFAAFGIWLGLGLSGVTPEAWYGAAASVCTPPSPPQPFLRSAGTRARAT
jgi:cation transport ATPase